MGDELVVFSLFRGGGTVSDLVRRPSEISGVTSLGPSANPDDFSWVSVSVPWDHVNQMPAYLQDQFHALGLFPGAILAQWFEALKPIADSAGSTPLEGLTGWLVCSRGMSKFRVTRPRDNPEARWTAAGRVRSFLAEAEALSMNVPQDPPIADSSRLTKPEGDEPRDLGCAEVLPSPVRRRLLSMHAPVSVYSDICRWTGSDDRPRLEVFAHTSNLSSVVAVKGLMREDLPAKALPSSADKSVSTDSWSVHLIKADFG